MHGFLSLQSTGGLLHCPVAGSQTSWVHGLPSPQSCALPTQAMGPPPGVRQASPEVQASWSSQGVPTERGAPAHCPEASQLSDWVQAFPSSQLDPAGWLVPKQPNVGPTAWQLSPVVQEFPSLQAEPAGML